MVRHGRDRCREFDWINGLRDMRLESCRTDSSPIFGARVARQRDRGETPSVFDFILLRSVTLRARPLDLREPRRLTSADER